MANEQLEKWLNNSKGESYIYDGLVEMLKSFLSKYIRNYPEGSASINMFLPKDATIESGLVEYQIFEEFLVGIAEKSQYVSVNCYKETEIPYTNLSIKLFGDSKDTKKILKYIYSNSEYIYDLTLSRMISKEILA